MTRHRSVLIAAGRPVAQPLWIARTAPERMRGLLGRSGLPAGEALLIERCNGVHTFGMQFAIDVLFLDRDGTVLKAFPGLRPWRMAHGGTRARYALEAAAGSLDPDLLAPGTRFAWADPDFA